jgi:hypothetical protein
MNEYPIIGRYRYPSIESKGGTFISKVLRITDHQKIKKTDTNAQAIADFAPIPRHIL